MKTPVRLGLGAAVTGVLLVAGPVTWMAVVGDAPVESVSDSSERDKRTEDAVSDSSERDKRTEDAVSDSVLSDALLPGGLPALAKGSAKTGADVSVVTLTIRPGAEGGWHSHTGTSLVSIVWGTASLVQAEGFRCVTREVPAGRPFVERSGVVHTVRNNGAVDLVLTAVSVSAHGLDSGHDETPPTICGG